jgi:hypothetical protein
MPGSTYLSFQLKSTSNFQFRVVMSPLPFLELTTLNYASRLVWRPPSSLVFALDCHLGMLLSQTPRGGNRH